MRRKRKKSPKRNAGAYPRLLADGLPRPTSSQEPRFEKTLLKPVRSIEIFSEPSEAMAAPNVQFDGKAACCYEYQIEWRGTRLFLRSTYKHELIHARRLTPTAGGSCVLISVDDHAATKLCSRRYGEMVDKRPAPQSFVRKNALWLLILISLLIRNYYYLRQADAWRWSVLPYLDLTPYGATALFVFSVWIAMRWPFRQRYDLRRTRDGKRGSSRSDVTSSLGEHIEAARNIPATSCAESDGEAAKCAGLLCVEGAAKNVRFRYVDRKGDEYDASIIICNFLLQRPAGDFVCCLVEVPKKSSLFFLRDGDSARVLGKVRNGALEVEHALNLTDGHIFSALQERWWTVPRYSRPGSRLSLFAAILYASLSTAGVLAGALVVFALLLFWLTGMLVGFGAGFWDFCRGALPFAAGGFALICTYGAFRGYQKAKQAVHISRALGLAGNELISRARVVCNQEYCDW